jgi:hypothetical protein
MITRHIGCSGLHVPVPSCRVPDATCCDDCKSTWQSPRPPSAANSKTRVSSQSVSGPSCCLCHLPKRHTSNFVQQPFQHVTSRRPTCMNMSSVEAPGTALQTRAVPFSAVTRSPSLTVNRNAITKQAPTIATASLPTPGTTPSALCRIAQAGTALLLVGRSARS